MHQALATTLHPVSPCPSPINIITPLPLRPQAVALLIAIAFHQGIEGVALGAMFVRARFSRTKALVYLVLYALTVPVAVGLALAARAPCLHLAPLATRAQHTSCADTHR